MLVTPLFDGARDMARGELPGGPFRGVPMLLKDLVAHPAGDPLYEGSAFLRTAGWVEREDSYLVRAFKAAGVQLVAAYGREDVLIRVAAQLEAAQPRADRWPDVSAA